MRPIVVSAVGVLLLAGCGTSAVVQPGGERAAGEAESSCAVTVGVVGLTDGVVASMGDSAAAGFAQWLAETNAAGGVGGRDVTVVTRAVPAPAQADAAARELVDQGASVIITPVSSDASTAAGAVAVKAGVPAISWAGTAPQIVETVGKGMFSNGHSDRAQGDALARYAREQGYSRALTLRGPDTLFTDGLPRYFLESFIAEGGTSVGEEIYRNGDTRFDAVVKRLKAGEADVLVTAAYGPELVALLQQLRREGVTVPVLGADGASDPVIAALPEAEGFAYTSYVVADPQRTDEVERGIARRSGTPAFPLVSLLGYETGLVLEDAIERSPTCAPADIGAALSQTKDVEGLTGSITFAGGDGMAIRPMNVVTVSGGQVVTAG